MDKIKGGQTTFFPALQSWENTNGSGKPSISGKVFYALEKGSSGLIHKGNESQVLYASGSSIFFRDPGTKTPVLN